MPYPSKIDRETIVQTAREMIEAEGGEQVSLHKLAERLGVQTPSLYRYVRNKTELLRAVNELTGQELFTAINDGLANAPSEPEARLVAVATAYRLFAHANPGTYGLLFATTLPELRPDPDEQERLALPLQDLMAQVSGEVDSLPALRGAFALIHGFVTLELNGQFRRGGHLESAFMASMRAYVRGWKSG